VIEALQAMGDKPGWAFPLEARGDLAQVVQGCQRTGLAGMELEPIQEFRNCPGEALGYTTDIEHVLKNSDTGVTIWQSFRPEGHRAGGACIRSHYGLPDPLDAGRFLSRLPSRSLPLVHARRLVIGASGNADNGTPRFIGHIHW
jgi:hypothetical protein